MAKPMVANYIDSSIINWDYQIVQIPRKNTTPIPPWLTNQSTFYPIAEQDRLDVNIYECDRWSQYHLIPSSTYEKDDRDKAAKVIKAEFKKMNVNWQVI